MPRCRSREANQGSISDPSCQRAIDDPRVQFELTSPTIGYRSRKGYRWSELLAFTPRLKLNRLVDEVRAEIHPFCPLRDTFPQNGQHNLKPTTIDRYLGIIDLPTLLYFTPL
jgi:hypothetical protein